MSVWCLVRRESLNGGGYRLMHQEMSGTRMDDAMGFMRL